MEKKINFTSFGKKLFGLLNVPDKIPAPGIVFFHGLSNGKTDCPLISETTEMLINEGFFTLRFDFFGSGESPGFLKDKTWGELRQNAIGAIKYFSHQKGITKIGLWGRSLGGTFAILTGDISRVGCIVLASPDVLVTRTLGKEKFTKLKKRQEELEKEGKTLPGTGKFKGPLELNENFFRSLREVEQEALEKLPELKNVLVLATTPDIKVPIENSTTIINMVQEPKKIIIFENVEHDYSGVQGEAVKEIINWFKKYLMTS